MTSVFDIRQQNLNTTKINVSTLVQYK